jgi:uncharacterized membrane protein YcaP (DUF421 family)
MCRGGAQPRLSRAGTPVAHHRNLRQELMSVEDLLAKLREKGVERPEQVKRAYMESDGTITVIKRAGSPSP